MHCTYVLIDVAVCEYAFLLILMRVRVTNSSEIGWHYISAYNYRNLALGLFLPSHGNMMSIVISMNCTFGIILAYLVEDHMGLC